MPDPDLDPTPSDERGAPDDVELADFETALARALGGISGPAEAEALATFGDPRPSAASPARPSFRSSLRASFVSGRFEGDGAAPSVVARALDVALLPAASVEFRSALRARFLAARTDEAPVAPASLLRLDAAPAGSAPRAPRGGAGRTLRALRQDEQRPAEPPRPSARSWPRYGAVAALAAVLLAAVLLRGQLGWPSAGPGEHGTAHWTLFGASSLTGLLVDGKPVADRAALEAHLSAGAALETGTDGVRIAVGREVVIDLGPHTRARVPAYISAGGLTFELERGALRVATGVGFQPTGGGRRLAIVTPHVEALASGTVFGVDCTTEYSCVCCFEGEALLRSLLPGGTEERVAAGRTRLVFADGRALELELVPEHRLPLVELHEAWRT